MILMEDAEKKACWDLTAEKIVWYEEKMGKTIYQ
jgi:hypothetical protein